MSTRYLPMLEEIKAQLAAINPARVVTRSYRDFKNRQQEDLLAGVWMVVSAGVRSYPYEVSDGQFDSDSLRATEHGRLVVRITGQLLLADPDSDGEAIDAAEFQLLHEVEQLADAVIEIPDLMALVLKNARTSQQVDAPLAWLDTEWEVFPLT